MSDSEALVEQRNIAPRMCPTDARRPLRVPGGVQLLHMDLPQPLAHVRERGAPAAGAGCHRRRGNGLALAVSMCTCTAMKYVVCRA